MGDVIDIRTKRRRAPEPEPLDDVGLSAAALEKAAEEARKRRLRVEEARRAANAKLVAELRRRTGIKPPPGGGA